MLIAYEDQRFFEHFGVDLYALGRVILEVVRYRKVVSGASTLTMQLARLLDPNCPKNNLVEVPANDCCCEIRKKIY